jgi:hypothetical protein
VMWKFKWLHRNTQWMRPQKHYILYFVYLFIFVRKKILLWMWLSRFPVS